MTQKTNGTSNNMTEASSSGNAKLPQPKAGLRVSRPSVLRRMRRSIGGTVAYLASWWRY